MENTIKTNNDEIKVREESGSISEVTEELLLDARSSLENKKTISVPIGKLSSLGAGVSSLIPALHTVTTTTTFSTDKLYRIANQATGDTLKMAKDGTAWGAMKTQVGKSKMAKLAEAGPLSATSQAVVPIDPATMMMAVALYSIEKELGEIAKTQKQIWSFMEFKMRQILKVILKQSMNFLLIISTTGIMKCMFQIVIRWLWILRELQEVICYLIKNR